MGPYLAADTAADIAVAEDLNPVMLSFGSIYVNIKSY